MERVWIRRGSLPDFYRCGPVPGGASPESAAGWRATFDRFIRGARTGDIELWVADAGGRLVGRLCLVWVAGYRRLADGSRRAYLCALEVDPPYRGAGVGGALVRRAVRRAWERGFTEVTIGVEAGDECLRELYRHWGFATALERETVDEFRLDAAGRPREVKPFDLLLKKLPDPAWETAGDRPPPDAAAPALTDRPMTNIFYPIFFGLFALVSGVVGLIGGYWGVAAAGLAAAVPLGLWAGYAFTKTFTLGQSQLETAGWFGRSVVPLADVRHVALLGGDRPWPRVVADNLDGTVRELDLPIELVGWEPEIVVRSARAQGLPRRDLTLGTGAASQPGARVARGAGLWRPGA